MKFTKMHGAGNDYIYVDGFADQVPVDPAAAARLVADRHRGVGGDGLILILPSNIADARMRMFNADGSEAQMCGNGLRCVGKYLYDHGHCRRSSLRVATGAGVLDLELELDPQGLVDQVTVDMGPPILSDRLIPTLLEGDPVIDQPLQVGEQLLKVTCVSMGNPHCIVYVPELNDHWVGVVGPQIESHPAFPERVNVEFVQVLSRSEVRQRTWERGSGETQACGTGASAVCVAGVLTQRTDAIIKNHLLGGDLELTWPGPGHSVLMKGPASQVFSGQWMGQPIALTSELSMAVD